jgi:hypothetical protein
MKKILLLGLSASLCLPVAAQQTETRHVTGFTGIKASNVFVITLVKGTSEALTITADEQIMPHVRSEVRNGILELSLDQPAKTRKVQTLEATVTLKDLTRIELSGACRLSSRDMFSPASFSARLRGVTVLQLSLKTGELDIEASGSNEIDLHIPHADRATLAFSGGTQANIALTAAEVKCIAQGTSSVTLTGTAGQLAVECSGATAFRASDFVAQNVSVQAHGAGSVEVHVTDALHVRASGVASVRYKGNPSSFDMLTGNAAQLKRMEN